MKDAWVEEGCSRIPRDRPIQHTHCVLSVERCWNRSEPHLLSVLPHTAFTKSSVAGWELIGLVCVTVAGVAHEVFSTQHRSGTRGELVQHLATGQVIVAL